MSIAIRGDYCTANFMFAVLNIGNICSSEKGGSRLALPRFSGYLSVAQKGP